MRSGTGSAGRRKAKAESLRWRIVETVKIQKIVREIRNDGTIQTGCQFFLKMRIIFSRFGVQRSHLRIH